MKQKIRFKEHCIQAKIDLSYKNEVEIEVESLAGGKDLFEKITRAKFEELCSDLFEKCKEPILEVLQIAKEDKKNIDEIVLVGGSTRIPKIQSILQEFFNGKKLNKKLNPDEAVAYGATIEAAMEMGEYVKDISLLDVYPFSLGVGIKEDKTYKDFCLEMSKIIKKGSKLPLKIIRKDYKPTKDCSSSSSLKIEVLKVKINL